MNDYAYKRLGELLLDEVLLRAGLAQTSSEPVRLSVDFVVDADRDTERVVLRCERINSPPIELRFPLHAD